MGAENTEAKKRWSLRAWLRRIFKRRPDKSATGPPTTATQGRNADVPSPRSNLTKAEKRMIMKAARGHWYMCRQNHPYLVGNCGVPLEFAFCPTCGECIGGQGHTIGARSVLGTKISGII